MLEIIHYKSNAHPTESWLAILDGEVIGHTNMQREENSRIKFLDTWVHEEHRRKGIFRKLWETRWEYVKDKYKGYSVYAWCKPNSLPLLLEKGFREGETCTYVESIIE
jgi:predicted GNAT family acetyltransferase